MDSNAPNPAPAPAAPPALLVEGLCVHYGVIAALREVSLRVGPGEVVCLVGGNGAGKTTLLRTISGLLKPRAGTIAHEGQPIARRAPDAILRGGLAHVPEGRLVFANLTVEENLRLGGYLRTDRAGLAADLEEMYAFFPRLRERLRQLAGTLSGGEQQMLAIARALMARPRFLMLDEPSLGIAPLLTQGIFAKIREINATRRLPMLLVEQNANLALSVAHRGYVLEAGAVVLEGPAEELRAHPKLKAAYLGG